MNYSTIRPKIAVLLAATVVASPGWAQSTADAARSPKSAPQAIPKGDVAPAVTPGDIVVTATKRSENVQRVPIAISVLTGESIANKQLRDGIALARETPNLVAESIAGAANPRFRLRGIGSNDFVPTGTSAVGVYEDEVFLNSGAAQSAPLYDMARVEVLYGPQGSLWGKNTVAGTIAYVTQKPSQSASGRAGLVYGSNNTFEAEGAYGAPLTDTLSARIAGVYKRRDGQFHNDYTSSKTGKYELWDVRGQLLWNFAVNSSLLIKVTTGQSDVQVPIRHIGLLAGGTDADGYAQGPGKEELSNNTPDDSSAHRFATTERLIVDLGGPTLTDIASYNRSRSILHSDDDANPISRYGEQFGGHSGTFTNELRIASQDDLRFGWIVGGFYLWDRTASFGSFSSYSNTNFGVDGTAYDLHQTTNNAAAFTSLSYKITDTLRLRAGARYNWEKKTAGGTAYDYIQNNTSSDPYAIFDASRPAAVFLDTANNIYNFAGQPPASPPPPSTTVRRVTWDGSLDYNATSNILIFGRVARGFRSGNYNTYVAAPGDFGAFKPETLTSYELGAKTSWFDRKLIVNVTAYHYDFRDLQVFILQQIGARPGNAAKARVNGFEVATTIRPMPSLTLNGSYGLAASKYLDFKNASAPGPINRGQPLDLSGQPFERAPKHTINLEASYDVDVGSGKLTVSTDWRYTSRFRFQAWSDATNTTPAPFLANPATQQLIHDSFSRPDLWLGNGRISYKLASGLEFHAWVQNMTGKRYNTSAFGSFFNRAISTYPGERRTYGVGASYRF